MVAYKVRKSDGTWYTLGSTSGAVAKIRRTDGSWVGDDGSGLLAKVRKVDGTMASGVPFGAGGAWEPTVYFTDPAYRTTGVLASYGQCRLSGLPGVAPTGEIHLTTGTSAPVTYQHFTSDPEINDLRQDAIVWLNPRPSVPGLTQPTPPSGYTVEHIDGTATTVRPSEYDVSVRDIFGPPAGFPTGWQLMIHEADDPRDLGGDYTTPTPTNVSPVTQHASNGPTGLQLSLGPTSGSRADVSVSPNSAGDFGVHMALTWSVSGTTWTVTGVSQTIGSTYPVYEEGFTYVKAYTLARHNPAGSVTTSDFVSAGSAGSQPSAWQDSSNSTYYYFESDDDPAPVARFTINREANMTATDFEHLGFALTYSGNGATVWLENAGVQVGDAVTLDSVGGTWTPVYELFGGWGSTEASAAWAAYSSVSVGAATPLKLAVRNDSSGFINVSYLALRTPLGS